MTDKLPSISASELKAVVTDALESYGDMIDGTTQDEVFAAAFVACVERMMSQKTTFDGLHRTLSETVFTIIAIHGGHAPNCDCQSHEKVNADPKPDSN